MSLHHGTPAGSARRPPKPQRILACVLCQQRKVKCDRKFPCNHCIKAKVQCVPATQMPRRRRRPTEQELIDRLRRYEDLLHQNNIAIESTDDVDTEEQPASVEPVGPQSTGHTYFDMTAGTVKSSGTAKKIKSESQTLGEVKNFWDVMHQRATDNQNHTEKATVDNNFENPTFDDLSEPVIVKVWGRVFENDHNHLFGPSKIDVSLCNLHPSHVHIFRFWQVYSDRINPLLKVTHAPTLQASILDAAADVAGTTRELEALMFSIYCVALISLDEESCRSMFGESKKVLLKRYQDACHQALINCGFLKSRERDCLTAFFLYLVSLRPDTHPHSLSPMFAIAFRIAYRMNISSEDANAKHGVFEAEMRRRLWWAMVTYDSRISEMTDYKTTQLIPTWDCHVPANVNDFDLRPEMTTRPTNQEASTEALFAVIRGEIGNSIRHNALHLDFINPMLKHIAKATQHLFDPHDDNLHSLESSTETRLAHCNPEIPLHYMTLWWTRSYLAKYRFFLHCSQHARSPAHQPTPQRSAILSHALRMLECDTALLASPLTAPYRWLLHFHFPFPAYVRIVQDLKTRPLGPHADSAWAVMTANYAARFADMEPSANLLFKMFASTVLQAWAARRAALVGQADAGAPHGMIADIQRKLDQAEPLLRGGDEVPDVQAGLLAAEGRGLNLVGQGQGQEMLGFSQDPGFAELNADLFDWDWANVDCIAMPGLAWP